MFYFLYIKLTRPKIVNIKPIKAIGIKKKQKYFADPCVGNCKQLLRQDRSKRPAVWLLIKTFLIG